MVAVRIVESILDGDIGTLICALFPFAIATWWIIRVHILSARKWKPPLVSWEGGIGRGATAVAGYAVP